MNYKLVYYPWIDQYVLRCRPNWAYEWQVYGRYATSADGLRGVDELKLRARPERVVACGKIV